MAALTAKEVLLARSPSDWVHKIWLLCDDSLVVQFKHGQKVEKILDQGPGAYLGRGGAPGICCHYPQTKGTIGQALFDAARVWPYAGEWVHAFLYKKFGYLSVLPPVVGTCDVQTNCCPQPIPTTLHATLGGAYSGTVTLLWDNAAQAWSGSIILCGGEPSTFTLKCGGSSWEASVTSTNGCGIAGFKLANSAICDPLALTFDLVGDLPANCCQGIAFSLTVTE